MSGAQAIPIGSRLYEYFPHGSIVVHIFDLFCSEEYYSILETSQFLSRSWIFQSSVKIHLFVVEEMVFFEYIYLFIWSQ